MPPSIRFDQGDTGIVNRSRSDLVVGVSMDIVAVAGTVAGTASFAILGKTNQASTAALTGANPLDRQFVADVPGKWRMRITDTADGSSVVHTITFRTAVRNQAHIVHNERANADANDADADPTTWVDASETNEGGHFRGYADDHNALVDAVEGSAELGTGWISGGAVTINGSDPAKFDMAAGFVWIKGNPLPVKFGPFVAEDPLNLATQEFTIPAIDVNGALQKFNVVLTEAQRDTLVELQAVVHADNATVTAIGTFRQLAVNVPKALVDYVFAAGPLNSGNNYLPASTDLTVTKTVGKTSWIFLNASNDLADPNGQPNPAIPVVTFLREIRDGAGDFILVPTTVTPVGFWDNDTGVLLATPKYVIYQFRFFNFVSVCVVGQATYDTLDEAVAAVFIEDPVVLPGISAQRNNFRTAIVARGDVTDLTDPVNVRFIQISTMFPGGMMEQGTL